MNLAIRIGSDAIGGIITGAAIGSLFGERWAAIGAAIGFVGGVRLGLWGHVMTFWQRITEWVLPVYRDPFEEAGIERPKPYVAVLVSKDELDALIANRDDLLERLTAAADALEIERTRAGNAERLAARAEEDLAKERGLCSAVSERCETLDRRLLEVARERNEYRQALDSIAAIAVAHQHREAQQLLDMQDDANGRPLMLAEKSVDTTHSAESDGLPANTDGAPLVETVSGEVLLRRYPDPHPPATRGDDWAFFGGR